MCMKKRFLLFGSICLLIFSSCGSARLVSLQIPEASGQIIKDTEMVNPDSDNTISSPQKRVYGNKVYERLF